MRLFDNEIITIYRDTELEAFYDVDSRYRRKIVLAHGIVHFFPVLAAVLISQVFALEHFSLWLVAFSLFLYAIVLIETASYLYPKSRTFYKTYFLWIIIPAGLLIGMGGYVVGQELASISQQQSVEMRTLFWQILMGGLGIFALFLLSQLGLSQILQASRSIYSRKARVEADIRFATEVQQSILKDVSIDTERVKAYGCSFPASDVGGDFFELRLKEHGLFASIGDISGHSFGAGLLMSMTKSALQTHLNYNSNPAEVLAALNLMLKEQASRELFATMVLLKMDLPARKVTLSNAGHLPVLHIPAGSDAIIRRHVNGLGLGMTTSASYSNLEFNVHSGDLLILISDGLVETRDAHKKVRDLDFFEQKVRDVVATVPASPADLAHTLIDEIRTSDHSTRMEDDSSVIVIKMP